MEAQRKENALQLLHENVKSESLRRHCLAVAAAMRAYAKKYFDEEKIADDKLMKNKNENGFFDKRDEKNKISENEFDLDRNGDFVSNGKIGEDLVGLEDNKLIEKGNKFDNYIKGEVEDNLVDDNGRNNYKRDEIIEKWWVCGLLHDYDWEIHPTMEQHPVEGVKKLRELGYDDEICEAVLGHGNHTGVQRKSLMAKTLFAVDELCGLIVALARVRPLKFEGMDADSVKKAMKKKDFAAAINREDILQGIQELGVDEREHFEIVIRALNGIKEELGF